MYKLQRYSKFKKAFSVFLIILLTFTLFFRYESNTKAADSFEASIAAFPESYKPYLRALHEAHPNWTFEAFNTGLDWNTVLTNESLLSRKLVPATGHKMSLGLMEQWSWYATPTPWKAYDEISGAYNYPNDVWVSFDTGAWCQASKSAISYVMDPRNWLNGQYMFMFERLTYNEGRDTADIVNSTLKGTFMYNTQCPGAPNNMTYAQVIVAAAKKAKVSAVHLAVRLVQEKGTSNDELGKGVSTKDGKNFYQANGDGNTVYYNYFNIGASGSGKQTVINNGGKEAMAAGWTSPYLAIMGGAVKVYNGYISIGQDTIYFEMFSVVDPRYYYWKQYAQNLTATLTEGSKICTTYEAAGITESSFLFRIPVYNNMPDSPCPRPASPTGDIKTTANPNYRLKSISIKGTDLFGRTSNISITPTFNMETRSYSVVVPYEMTSINISAAAVSGKATVSGTGTKNLTVGNNKFDIVCKSEYGTSCTYSINVTRSSGSTLLTSIKPTDGSLTPAFSSTVTKYEYYVANDVEQLQLNYTAQTTYAKVVLRDVDCVISEPEEGETDTEGTTENNKEAATDPDVVISETGIPHKVVTQTLSGGITPYIYLSEGNNVITFDVYPSEDDESVKTTYVVNIHRYGKCEYNLNDYKVKDSYIYNFTVGDIVSKVISKITVSNGKIKMFDKNGKEKTENQTIVTGDILRIYDNYDNKITEYNIIIYGDVNGDGKTDVIDFLTLRKYILKELSLTGIYLQAADVYKTSAGVDVMDFLYFRKYILHEVIISQK